MTERMDIILLYIEQGAQRLAFYVGENGRGHIPVFRTWTKARELADVMGRRFGYSLAFAVLAQVTRDSFEENYIKAFTEPLEYSFVYENTPEFDKLERMVRS